MIMNYDEDVLDDIVRSNYAGMLHDDERNKKYFQALKSVINELKSNGMSQVCALDIGAGTGILSMMAAVAGATEVTACEMFEPMSITATKIIEKNNLNHIVQVVNKSSTDLTVSKDMQRKADVLVTEVFDTELIGEGVLPILRDAHKRLINTKCKVVPEAADVNIQLIECDKLWRMNKLVSQQCQLKLPQTFTDCTGTAAAHEIQINQLYPDQLSLLTHPDRITSFDFQKPFIHNTTSKISKVDKCLKVDKSGVIHGVLFWWDLVLYKKGNIVLSMEPIWMRKNEKYIWRDHWMQAVYYVKQPLIVSKGDDVFIEMCYDDYSIWFNVTLTKSKNSIERPLCTCGLHVVWPRERFAMWNDRTLQESLRTLLKANVMNTVVIGDTSLFPIYSTNKPALTYVECSESPNQVIQKISNLNMTNKFESIPMKKINQLRAECNIVCEPYFSSCLLPWHHLMKMWCIMGKINDQLHTKHSVTPSKAQLKCCIVELADLWKVRAPVNTAEGFNLSEYDMLIENAVSATNLLDGRYQTAEPYSLWEYENNLLNEPTVLVKFDISAPDLNSSEFTGILCIEKPGIAHAAVLWIDYMFDEKVCWTTGLDKHKEWVNYCRQGVYFLNQPKFHDTGDTIEFKLLVQADQCEIVFTFE